MISEKEKPRAGLGGRLLLNADKGGTGWPSVSDAGGVTANAAPPCVPSAESDFFLALRVTGNCGEGAGEQGAVTARL